MSDAPTIVLPDGATVRATVVLWQLNERATEITWRAVNRYYPDHTVDEGTVAVRPLEHPQNRLDKVIAVVNGRGHCIDGYYEEFPDPHVQVRADAIAKGMIIDDERFSHVMKVGYVTVGRKWVSVRSFHPEVHVYPNAPFRIPRDDSVRVVRSSLPTDYADKEHADA